MTEPTGRELEHFDGNAPLFPLPNSVLFPQILLPLHIFEPRYREMVEAAWSGDRLIAMGLVKPGFEALYETKHAEVFDVVCLGHLSALERLPDGRFYVMLRGLCRAKIVAQLDDENAYRTVRLEVLEDRVVETSYIDRDRRRAELIDEFRGLSPEMNLDQHLVQALDADLPLGVLCDILAFALPLPPSDRQRVLESLDTDERSELLLTSLRELRRAPTDDSSDPPFPPKFSVN